MAIVHTEEWKKFLPARGTERAGAVAALLLKLVAGDLPVLIWMC